MAQHKELLEITESDLDLLEKRVSEMERYLGIEEMQDEGVFEGNFSYQDPIIKKAQTCSEFITAMEGKFFIFKDLYKKVEQLEAFLKKDSSTVQGSAFKSLCLDLQKKSYLINENAEEILQFVEYLQELKSMEQYLNFEPIYDVKEKLEEIKSLKKIHLENLIENDENSSELETLVSSYNEMVTRISEQLLRFKALKEKKQPSEQAK